MQKWVYALPLLALAWGHQAKAADIEAGKAKVLPVKRGISDEAYYEILEGLTEGQEIVTGSYKAIARELEDEKPTRVDNTKKNAKRDEKK